MDRNTKKSINIKWLQFKGMVLKNCISHLILKATDGSNGVIKVKPNDFRLIEGKIFLRRYCEIEFISRPRTHPAIASN